MKNFFILLVGVVIGIFGFLVFDDLIPQEDLKNECNIPNEIIMELEFYRYNHDRLVKGIMEESE